MTTDSIKSGEKTRYTIEEIRRDVADWLEFGPPAEVQDNGNGADADAEHRELVEELVIARRAANPNMPASRVLHQVTQADTDRFLEDTWYSAAGDPIDNVTDENQADFREEVRRELARCPKLSRAVADCLERAFERYSARIHGDDSPFGADYLGEYPVCSDPDDADNADNQPVPIDEFDDEPEIHTALQPTL